MALNHDDIRRLARLARIAISADEVAAVQGKLDGVFALIARMNQVDTTGIEPMAHAQAVSLRLRDDRVSETDQRDKFQAVAPRVEQGLYLVPKVIE
jgi:aspartyl-tRNA(Asn)/glutamyl-tRNA(Gln) amidotransferase subunit C